MPRPSLTWEIITVLGQPLSAEQDGVGISAIIGLVYLPNFHCVIYQVIVQDLQWEQQT